MLRCKIEIRREPVTMKECQVGMYYKDNIMGGRTFLLTDIVKMIHMGCMQGKTAQRKKVEDSFANGRAKQHLFKKIRSNPIF